MHPARDFPLPPLTLAQEDVSGEVSPLSLFLFALSRSRLTAETEPEQHAVCKSKSKSRKRWRPTGILCRALMRPKLQAGLNQGRA